MRALQLLLVALSLLFFASCRSSEVLPGSERLRVFEAEPKGCIFLGEIHSLQEDMATKSGVQDIEMELPTRVELRNKAFKLNGNVIIFLTKGKKASSGPVYSSPVDPKKEAASANAAAASTAAPVAAVSSSSNESEMKVKTLFIATVFRCPPAIVNQ